MHQLYWVLEASASRNQVWISGAMLTTVFVISFFFFFLLPKVKVFVIIGILQLMYNQFQSVGMSICEEKVCLTTEYKK